MKIDFCELADDEEETVCLLQLVDVIFEGEGIDDRPRLVRKAFHEVHEVGGDVCSISTELFECELGCVVEGNARYLRQLGFKDSLAPVFPDLVFSEDFLLG